MSHGKTPSTHSLHAPRSLLMAIACFYASFAASAPVAPPDNNDTLQEEQHFRAFALDHYLSDLRRFERISFQLLKSAAPYCHDAQGESLGIPPITAKHLPEHLRQTFQATIASKGNAEQPRFMHVIRGSPVARGGVREGDALRFISVQDRTVVTHPTYSWTLNRSVQSLTLQNSNPIAISTTQQGQHKNNIVNPIVICRLLPRLTQEEKPAAQVDNGQLVVSTGLLRELTSDDELALILAHQIAAWLTLPTTPQPLKERNADYIAPFLLHSAGYNVANAKNAWLRLAQRESARHAVAGLIQSGYTVQRAINFRAVQDEIHAQQLAGKRVLPSGRYLPAPIASRFLPAHPADLRSELPQQPQPDSLDPRLSDLSAVPIVDEQGLARYQRFLDNPIRPRAFAIGVNRNTGNWRAVSRFGANAAADAISTCELDLDGSRCHLYALNDHVVWNPRSTPDRISPNRVAVSLSPKRAAPPASGYARIDDLSALPANNSQQQNYASFLDKPSPRALVVMADGSSKYWLGTAAMENALEFCETSPVACWLYAVDESVVWHTNEDQRISRRTQLPLRPSEQDFF